MNSDDGVDGMTKRWLAAAALVLALGGCGDDDATTPVTVPVPTVTSTAPEPAATVTASAGASPVRSAAGASSVRAAAGPDAFVAAVRRALPEVAADRRDEEIAAVAEQACSELADGEDADTVVAHTRTLGTLDAQATDQATARELIKLAIDTVCPGQDRRVDEF